MNIPPELVNIVGKYLKPQEICQLCLVNKDWNKQWTSLLYAHVSITAEMLHDGRYLLPSLEKHAGAIDKLSLSQFGDSEFDCVMCCLSSSRAAAPDGHTLFDAPGAGVLSKITLVNPALSYHMMNVLFKSQPNLKEIVIVPTQFENNHTLAFEELVSLLPQWRLLETFECRNWYRPTTPWDTVTKLLSGCTRLRRFVLPGTLFEESDVFAPILQAPPLVKLDIASLSWHNIQKSSGVHPTLSRLLRNLPTLQDLTVRSQFPCELADTPAEQRWNYALGNIRALKRIEFSVELTLGVKLSRLQHSAAVDAFSTFSRSLTTIHFYRACEMTSDESYVNLFTQCEHLQHLTLHLSELSDVSLDALATTQENLARRRPSPGGLRSLTLRLCPNISAAPLSRILFCCKNLFSLSILECSLDALGLFTQIRGQPTPDNKETGQDTCSPPGALWACTNSMKELVLELNASRYLVDVCSPSSTGVEDNNVHNSSINDSDPYDSGDSSDSSNSSDSDDSDDSDSVNPWRIPDAFREDELALIRPQLDALVNLRVLELSGLAMSYDLLKIPCEPQSSVSSSFAGADGCNAESLQGDGVSATQGPKERRYRGVQPLTLGRLDSVRIFTNMYLPTASGVYQRRTDASEEERLSAFRAVKDWWQEYSMLSEKGRVMSEYRLIFPCIKFRVYSSETSEEY